MDSREREKDLPPDALDRALDGEVGWRALFSPQWTMWWFIIVAPTWFAYKRWGFHWQTALASVAGMGLYVLWLVALILTEEPPAGRRRMTGWGVALACFIGFLVWEWRFLTRG